MSETETRALFGTLGQKQRLVSVSDSLTYDFPIVIGIEAPAIIHIVGMMIHGHNISAKASKMKIILYG